MVAGRDHMLHGRYRWNDLFFILFASLLILEVFTLIATENFIHPDESEAAVLTKDWAEKDIETTLQKENKEGKAILLPLSIDDAIKFTEKPWAVKMRRAHRVYDFTMWEDSSEFQEAIALLMLELNAEEEERVEDNFEEDFSQKSDRYSAVINQKIAWNNIRHARLS